VVVLILERVPSGLRGELSRWMVEPKAGVFVGKVSAMVRDRLWEKSVKCAGDGACVMLNSSNTEQGFDVRVFGDRSREMLNVEGIWLVRVHQQCSR